VRHASRIRISILMMILNGAFRLLMQFKPF